MEYISSQCYGQRDGEMQSWLCIQLAVDGSTVSCQQLLACQAG